MAAGSLNEPSGSPSSLQPVRIPFVHGCRLTTAARARGGLVCNLSVLGAYVTLDEPLPEIGDVVQLAVTLPGQEPLLQADAVVASQLRHAALGADSLPPGVGVRFVSLSAVYKARIENLLRQYHEGRSSFVLSAPPHAGPRRVPYVQHCRLATAGGTIETLICNLSRLGTYVALDAPPAVGEEVGLSFVTPEGTLLELKGAVSWHSPKNAAQPYPFPPGCGVRFTSLSKLDELRIRSVVESFPRNRRP